MMTRMPDATSHMPPESISAARAELGRRVLIVEDERRLRDMLIASVKECGMVGTGAPTAEAALRLLNTESFAIALVDLNLPGLGGMDFCEQLHQRWPSVQVIILTGFGDLESAKRAIRLDVVDFLTKPCGMDELEVSLGRAQRRWQERSLTMSMTMTAVPPRGAEPPSSPLLLPHAATRGATHAAQPSPNGHVSAQSQPVPSPEPTLSMEEMERQLIFAALARHHGNREAAAADVGISVRKLYYRLQQYQKQGLQPPA
jgi:DNA-binding NtrC family response regulator